MQLFDSKVTKVRQVGFKKRRQVYILQITKYAEQLNDPNQIAAILDNACKAEEGRPGPVLVDIPDDLQRLSADTGTLQRKNLPKRGSEKTEQVRLLLTQITNSKRPVIERRRISTPRKVDEL